MLLLRRASRYQRTFGYDVNMEKPQQVFALARAKQTARMAIYVQKNFEELSADAQTELGWVKAAVDQALSSIKAHIGAAKGIRNDRQAKVGHLIKHQERRLAELEDEDDPELQARERALEFYVNVRDGLKHGMDEELARQAVADAGLDTDNGQSAFKTGADLVRDLGLDANENTSEESFLGHLRAIENIRTDVYFWRKLVGDRLEQSAETPVEDNEDSLEDVPVMDEDPDRSE